MHCIDQYRGACSLTRVDRGEDHARCYEGEYLVDPRAKPPLISLYISDQSSTQYCHPLLTAASPPATTELTMTLSLYYYWTLLMAAASTTAVPTSLTTGLGRRREPLIPVISGSTPVIRLGHSADSRPLSKRQGLVSNARQYMYVRHQLSERR